MKLQVFNGGLDIRKAPELIGLNEAVVCHNTEISSDQLAPANGLGSVNSTSNAYPYFFLADQVWFDQANVRDYVEYQGKLYWTDGNVAKKYRSGTIEDLGISAPSVVPTVAVGAGTGITGTFQYVYTYYNVNDGTESMPSPISSDLVLANQDATITVAASTDPQVTNIKIYRIGTALLNFTEVLEAPNTSGSHTDSTASSAVLGGALQSSTWGKAPVGLKYLGQVYGVFFGAVGQKLYFTPDLGNPNYWPATNYIDFHVDITGIVATTSGIIVFTQYETFMVTGTTASTFVKYVVDTTQGCINYKTIVPQKGAALFVSTDGICLINGSSIVVVSKIKLGKQVYSAVNAVVHDEVYYLQLADNSILALDMRYGKAFKTLDFSTTWLSISNDKLYGQTSTGNYELFQGTAVQLSYTTGNYTEGSLSQIKAYNDIYVYLTGTLTIAVSINGTVVATKTLTGTAKPVQLAVPQSLQLGSSISFAISGTGTLKEIEYKAVARQNGR